MKILTAQIGTCFKPLVIEYGLSNFILWIIASLRRELESDGLCVLYIFEGDIRAEPDAVLEDYFGKGMHYLLAPISVPIKSMTHFEPCDEPEDSMRQFFSQITGPQFGGVQHAIHKLHAEIDRLSIDGIIGLSQGAMFGASVILDEQRRNKNMGIEPRIKCAVFFSGAPPIRYEDDYNRDRDSTNSTVLLSDETDDRITIPTYHVMGSEDPWIHSCISLFNMCDPETAILLDHGGGHLIPIDASTTKTMAKGIRDMLDELD